MVYSKRLRPVLVCSFVFECQASKLFVVFFTAAYNTHCIKLEKIVCPAPPRFCPEIAPNFLTPTRPAPPLMHSPRSSDYIYNTNIACIFPYVNVYPGPHLRGPLLFQMNSTWEAYSRGGSCLRIYGIALVAGNLMIHRQNKWWPY